MRRAPAAPFVGADRHPLRVPCYDLGLVYHLTREPIDVAGVLSAMQDPACGGLAFFLGMVRDHSRGQRVLKLHYEAFEEMAVAEMKRIGEGVLREVDVAKIAVVHRVGELAIGDVAVITAAASPHRSEAFRACQLLINRVKQDVPIWKKEFFPDSATWV